MLRLPLKCLGLILFGVITSLAGPGARAETFNFSPRIPIAGGMPNCEFFRMADLNGDGRDDLIVTQFWDPYFEWFERKPGSAPDFIRHRVDHGYYYDYQFEVGDLDRDGDLDLVSEGDDANNNGFLLMHDNGGGANPVFTTRQLAPTGCRDLELADLDHDGDLDIATVTWGDRAVDWYENNGAKPPSFTRRIISNFVAQQWNASICAADLDGDGDLDLLTAAFNDDAVAWHENLGGTPPAFSTHHLATSDMVYHAAAADLDGDGDKDVLYCGFAGTLMLKNGGGPNPVFTPQPLGIGGTWETIYPADLNRDGRMDFLIRSNDDDLIHYYENGGGSGPSLIFHLFANDYRPRWLVVTDLDLDGDKDLVVLNRGSSLQGEPDGLFWYRNAPIVPVELSTFAAD